MLAEKQASECNDDLSDKSPEEIIEWAVRQDKRIMVSTSFGPFSAVMLHMATRIKPDLPIVWVDSGYNTRETYLYAEKLIQDLKLNIQVFLPAMTAARRSALMNGIPDVDNKLHGEFTRQVKLEPFARAIQAIRPELWLAAIRKDETDFRKTLDVLSRERGGVLKVAPFLHWTEADMHAYLHAHGLPQVEKYYDPTKALEKRECGLHTTDYSI